MQQSSESDADFSSRSATGLKRSFVQAAELESAPATIAAELPAVSPAAADSEIARHTLLLVDDTPANLKILARLLEKRGYQVELAEDGFEAVELYRAREFDLILMDLQMPGLDGFSATQAIRAMSDRRQVPIVALTAHVVEGTRERCLAVGMTGYLAKPVDFALLAQTVELQLKTHGGFR